MCYIFGDKLGKYINAWIRKSERTLGKEKGKGIFIKMLGEYDPYLKKSLTSKRKPIKDNYRVDKETI